MAAERLDDDLLGVEDVVDDEPEPLLLGLQDDDEAAALAVVAGHLLDGRVARPSGTRPSCSSRRTSGSSMSRSR